MTLLKVFLLALPALFAKVELPSSPYLQEQIRYETNFFFDSRSFTTHEVELLGLEAWSDELIPRLGNGSDIRLLKTVEGYIVSLKLNSSAENIKSVLGQLLLDKVQKSFDRRNGWSSHLVSDSFKQLWMYEYRQSVNEVNALAYKAWSTHPNTSAEQLKSCQLELL